MITVKRRFTRWSACLLVTLPLIVWVNGATLAETSELGSSEATEFELSEIRPGVFVHSGMHADIDEQNLGDIANIGFIAGEESVAVIDPGASPAIARALQASILRLTGLPVSHVILTHLHPDHMLGASAFPNSVQFIAHENYPRAALQRGAFYLDRYAQMLGIEPGTLEPPDRLIAVGETLGIELGERTLTVHAYPASHTDNDVTVHDSLEQVLWASDLVFEGRIPSLDGSITGWLATLDELEKRFAGNIVIPGHGKPGPLESTVAPQRQYLTTLANEIRSGIALNQPLSVAVEQVGRELEAHWRLFDLHHKGNVSKAWSELEWE